MCLGGSGFFFSLVLKLSRWSGWIATTHGVVDLEHGTAVAGLTKQREGMVSPFMLECSACWWRLQYCNVHIPLPWNQVYTKVSSPRVLTNDILSSSRTRCETPQLSVSEFLQSTEYASNFAELGFLPQRDRRMFHKPLWQCFCSATSNLFRPVRVVSHGYAFTVHSFESDRN